MFHTQLRTPQLSNIIFNIEDSSKVKPNFTYYKLEEEEEEEEEEGDDIRFENDLFFRKLRNNIIQSAFKGICLSHNDSNGIEIAEVELWGKATISSAKEIANNVLGQTFRPSKWEQRFKEFTAICNSPNVKENDIQQYINEYPEFILDDQYSNVISQAVIQNESDDFRADFILIPDHQDNFSKILEIKLPSAPLSKKHSHDPLSAQIYKGIRQLKNYQASFQNPRTVRDFQKRYGYEIIKPKLHLLIGRSESIHNLNAYKYAIGDYDITVETYDALFSTLKKKFSIK